MSFSKQLRIPLLVFTFASILLVFGRSVLDSTVGKQTSNFVFPRVVPLAAWKLVESRPLENKTIERPDGEVVVPGMYYRYTQNNLPLDVQMRYEVQADGNGKSFLKNYAAINSRNQPSITLREHKQLGFYGLFVDQQRAYLNSCINPQGGSTFTQEQFSYNRAHYNTQIHRLLPWLLGQQKLLDKRCLWTHLSIPLNQASPSSAYVILENAWFSWYQWWRSRFPEP